MEIFTEEYWRDRLRTALENGNLHKAVYEVNSDLWDSICKLHSDALLYNLAIHDSVLDVGCGYGRLVENLPATWSGDYVGIDISSDFIRYASEHYSSNRRRFYAVDIRAPIDFVLGRRFDWAVVAGTRPMIIEKAGQSTWGRIEQNIFDVTDKILFLEYSTNPDTAVEIKRKT